MTEQRIFLPYEAEFDGGSAESQAVQTALGLDPTQFQGTDQQEFEALVAITKQFSRTDPETGIYQIISPSRIASIPAITERHCRLLAPARGQLTADDIKESWWTNMPENDGQRHPDQLFDIAQYNFGTDDDVTHILVSFTRLEAQRRQMIEDYMSQARYRAAQLRYELPLDADERAEAAVDKIIDTWH